MKLCMAKKSVNHVDTLIESDHEKGEQEQETASSGDPEAGLYWHLELCKRVFERLRKNGYFSDKRVTKCAFKRAA